MKKPAYTRNGTASVKPMRKLLVLFAISMLMTSCQTLKPSVPVNLTTLCLLAHDSDLLKVARPEVKQWLAENLNEIEKETVKTPAAFSRIQCE